MTVVRRALLALLALVVVLALAVGVNTLRQSSQQPPLPAPQQPLAVDADAAAQSLAAAVRARTVSVARDAEPDAAQFQALHAHLAARYPRVHAALRREVVGRFALVYTWPGSDPQARPFALMAHQDTVPIAPGTESTWQQPPFAGTVQGGYVWGRGAWDDKGNLIAQLEAVEMLLASGFQPRRTLYLIFGDDEEVGGARGAARIAALFKQRGIQLDFVVDEGMLVVHDMLPGLARPAALVGVAEKGSASVVLTAKASGGHSSMPPARGDSAIGILAAALAKVDAHPMPGAIRGVARSMFDALAPDMGGMSRVALSNRWLFGPVVERQLERSPGSNALLRTTTALTVFNAGNKENVIPGSAEATVNFRLLPGDTAQTVLEHVRRSIDDPRIALAIAPGAFDASPVSSHTAPAFRHIADSARAVFPTAVVAPALMLGATDGRHFAGVADNVYRFSPITAGPADLPRFHGTDERLSVANLAEMIRFYHRLVQQANEGTSP